METHGRWSNNKVNANKVNFAKHTNILSWMHCMELAMEHLLNTQIEHILDIFRKVCIELSSGRCPQCKFSDHVYLPVCSLRVCTQHVAHSSPNIWQSPGNELKYLAVWCIRQMWYSFFNNNGTVTNIYDMYMAALPVPVVVSIRREWRDSAGCLRQNTNIEVLFYIEFRWNLKWFVYQ